MRVRALAGCLTLTACALFSACASSAEGRRTAVVIDVVNDMIPGSTITVYLVPQTGIERMLGTVIPGSRQELRYQGLPPVGEHRLMARTTGGARIVSNTIIMDGVSGLEWSLASNLVRVTSTRQQL
jgi:hypothetical protein